MRTVILSTVVSGLIALSLVACSGASVEPVDQSATAGSAKLADAPPATADASSDPSAREHHRGHRGPPDPAELVKRFDKNADGKLQVAELPEHMQQFIGKADANADGVVSVEELEAGQQKMRAEHLAKVDTDHDGKVSPEERKAGFEKFAQERFAKLDKNNDGALTKDEIGDQRWEHLSVADADKNGSVTQVEMRTALTAGTLKFPHHGRGPHGHGHGGGRGPGAGPDGAGTDSAIPAPAAAPNGS